MKNKKIGKCKKCLPTGGAVFYREGDFWECANCATQTAIKLSRKPRALKIPDYEEAVEYIALNDEPSELARGFVMQQISVHVVATLFDITVGMVADDVLKFRNNNKQSAE